MCVRVCLGASTLGHGGLVVGGRRQLSGDAQPNVVSAVGGHFRLEVIFKCVWAAGASFRLSSAGCYPRKLRLEVIFKCA